MRNNFFILFFCIPLLVLSGCVDEQTKTKEVEKDKRLSSSKGHIVKETENEITVLSGVTKEKLMGNQEKVDTLLAENIEDAIVFDLDHIDEEVKSSLHVGQQVIVQHDYVIFSTPPETDALEILILNE